MQNYLNLLEHILNNGVKKDDRTGVGTLSCFGYQMRFNLHNSFPLITTKKVHLKSIIYELLWFLKGETNIQYLKDNGINIWNAWANKRGDLGPIYGHQWRSWTVGPSQTIDQIKNVINLLKTNPESRRIIVSAWNVGDLDKMALVPCHCLFQFYVADQQLSCHLYQRSADAFLGVPFNIASYALLTMMIAQVCDLEPGEFIHSFGDVHLYINHIEQAKLQLTRSPYTSPKMHLNKAINNLFDFQFSDFKLKDYRSHPKIIAPIAI